MTKEEIFREEFERHYSKEGIDYIPEGWYTGHGLRAVSILTMERYAKQEREEAIKLLREYNDNAMIGVKSNSLDKKARQFLRSLNQA